MRRPGACGPALPIPDDLPGQLTAWVDKAVNHPNDRCASCHVEHVPAPAIAGLAPTQARALPLLKTINTCVDCHRSLHSRLPDTTLVDTPSWSRHPQFRPFLAFAAADGRTSAHRSDLVGPPTSVTGLIFSHRLHLLPAGGVARMAFELGTSRGYGGALDCAACHHADAAGRGFIPVRHGARLPRLPHDGLRARRRRRADPAARPGGEADRVRTIAPRRRGGPTPKRCRRGAASTWRADPRSNEGGIFYHPVIDRSCRGNLAEQRRARRGLRLLPQVGATSAGLSRLRRRAGSAVRAPPASGRVRPWCDGAPSGHAGTLDLRRVPRGKDRRSGGRHADPVHCPLRRVPRRIGGRLRRLPRIARNATTTTHPAAPGSPRGTVNRLPLGGLR